MPSFVATTWSIEEMKPKRLYFGTCPLCGSSEPFHSVRVIRLFSSEKKGKYLLYCKNAKKGHRFETYYGQK